MTFTIVGLTGKIGSGKDSVANILCNNFNFARVAFADPIRNGVSAMFDIPSEELNDRVLKETPNDKLCGRTPRYVMQRIGTELGRQLIADEIWIKTAELKISSLQKQGFSGVVITDVRFENEAEWFRNVSKNLWHVVRYDNPFETKSDSNHVSENGVTKLKNEIIIHNDGDLDYLEYVVKEIYNGISK